MYVITQGSIYPFVIYWIHFLCYSDNFQKFQDCKKLVSHPSSFRQCSLDTEWEAGLGGSMDSSHLILASQGSLAGLELLAARGSMRQE